MQHTFDVDIATELDIASAVIFQNLIFWCEKNKYNNINFFEENYWTYNSIRAFKEQFSYLSEKQIRNSLKNLEEASYIKSGIFNNSKTDRTKWYSVVNLDAYLSKKVRLDLPKSTNVDLPKSTNVDLPKSTNVIYTDNKHTDNKHTDNNKASHKCDINKKCVDFDFDGFSEKEVESIKTWLDYKKLKTQAQLTALRNKLMKLKAEHCLVESIENSLANNYAGLFIVTEKRYYAKSASEQRREKMQESLNKCNTAYDNATPEQFEF